MININDIQLAEGEKEPEFDSPQSSKWIVSVGLCGLVQVIETPNIHPGFFDNGMTAEDIGLPPDCELDPGVYEWVCSYHVSRDWESGVIDDCYFEVESEKLLWEPTNEES